MAARKIFKITKDGNLISEFATPEETLNIVNKSKGTINQGVSLGKPVNGYVLEVVDEVASWALVEKVRKAGMRIIRECGSIRFEKKL